MGKILKRIQNVLWAGTVIAGSLLPAGCQTAGLQEIYTRQKTENASKEETRQELLEEIVERYKLPYIADIIYYSEQTQTKYFKAMQEQYSLNPKDALKIWKKANSQTPAYDAATLIPESLIGAEKKSTIIVFPLLFNKSKKLDEIISCVIDNAGTHAKNSALGIRMQGKKITPKQTGEKTYQSILQIFAYSHQIKLINKKIRQVSSEYQQGLEKAYASTYTNLIEDAYQGNEYALAAFTNAPYALFANLDTGKINLIPKEKRKIVQKD